MFLLDHEARNRRAQSTSNCSIAVRHNRVSNADVVKCFFN
jgi:hypothetical protein